MNEKKAHNESKKGCEAPACARKHTGRDHRLAEPRVFYRLLWDWPSTKRAYPTPNTAYLDGNRTMPTAVLCQAQQQIGKTEVFLSDKLSTRMFLQPHSCDRKEDAHSHALKHRFGINLSQH